MSNQVLGLVLIAVIAGPWLWLGVVAPLATRKPIPRNKAMLLFRLLLILLLAPLYPFYALCKVILGWAADYKRWIDRRSVAMTAAFNAMSREVSELHEARRAAHAARR